ACTATFVATPADPDNAPLTYSWSGCATGSDATATCGLNGAGTLSATFSASDGRGGIATSSDTATVYATGYATGQWGSCTGTQSWTCTSNTATGCTRPGTQTRTVTETGWVWDVNPSVTAPASSQACTQTAQGYIASYNSTYDANWTCTAAGANGCYKNRLSYAVASYGPTPPDQPVPATMIYTFGYITAYSATYETSWTCTAGGATGCRKTRLSYSPSGYNATGPA